MSPESKADWLEKEKTPRQLAEMCCAASGEAFTYRNRCAALERQLQQLRALNDSQAATIRATHAGRPDCRWHYAGDYLWDTTCGTTFEIPDDPADAEPYCPRCGGRAVLTQEEGG